MDNKKKILGNAGEQMVAAWLEQQGYILICRNYKQSYGEIDLIARTHNTLCFVEVKTRTAPSFAISNVLVATKQRKIILTARSFIASYQASNIMYRFDVALVQLDHQQPITYIPNAFDAQDMEGIL